mmetsp:Transcript_24878/g.74889  ORF Transcript_24878/g.74889 Transcript_24878/m.74889 type:complete len:345 (-) Transcript_24878:182-1216(-)
MAFRHMGHSSSFSPHVTHVTKCPHSRKTQFAAESKQILHDRSLGAADSMACVVSHSSTTARTSSTFSSVVEWSTPFSSRITLRSATRIARNSASDLAVCSLAVIRCRFISASCCARISRFRCCSSAPPSPPPPSPSSGPIVVSNCPSRCSASSRFARDGRLSPAGGWPPPPRREPWVERRPPRPPRADRREESLDARPGAAAAAAPPAASGAAARGPPIVSRSGRPRLRRVASTIVSRSECDAAAEWSTSCWSRYRASCGAGAAVNARSLRKGTMMRALQPQHIDFLTSLTIRITSRGDLTMHRAQHCSPHRRHNFFLCENSLNLCPQTLQPPPAAMAWPWGCT